VSVPNKKNKKALTLHASVRRSDSTQVRNMKMKTSILSALIALAGSVTLMAQTNVYSLNAVGYVNTTIPNGFSIVANPLVAATNTLSVLIRPAPPEGTVVYKFVSGNYQIANYAQDDFGNLVWDNDLTVLPGEAFWVKNPGAAFTNTFVGEVSQGALTNQIPANFSLKSSIVPQSGQLDTVLGYPPSEGDVVYLFRANNYIICNYGQDDFGNLVWDNAPIPFVGEGFWIKTGAPKNWVRTFTTSN